MESNNCMQIWNPPVHATVTGTIQPGFGDADWQRYLGQNSYVPYAMWTQYITQAPTVCCGDVHVFPCPHCDKCKCGAATVKRQRK